MPHGPYVINLSGVSVSGAITLIQIKAGATVPVQLIEARVTQRNSTTSAMQTVGIHRTTTAGTVTSFTPLLENPNDPAASAVGGAAATGTNASAEGSASDILLLADFNVLSGFLWLPVPEDRIFVLPTGFIGLYFPVAPGAALTIDAQLKFLEYP